MPRFPSLEWCRAIEAAAGREPETAAAAREWGGASVGYIVGRGDGLAKDFCLFVKPHPTEPRLLELELCEDEDDLELAEPEFRFRVPFLICRQVLGGRLDPFEVLRRRDVQFAGDMKKVLGIGRKYLELGERVLRKVETVF